MRPKINPGNRLFTREEVEGMKSKMLLNSLELMLVNTCLNLYDQLELKTKGD